MGKILDLLGAPFSTDQLLEQLDEMRDALNEKAVYRTQLASHLERVEAKVLQVTSKSDFLVDLTGQTLEMFEPQEPEQMELDYVELKDMIYDPLYNIRLYTGVAGIVMVIIPNAVNFIGIVARSTKIVSAAKAGKLLTLAKVGKATVVFAVLISLIEVLIKIRDAKKINDYLSEKQEEISLKHDEADRVIARYEVAIEQNEKLVSTYLAEAGVENVEDYGTKIDEAIGEVAATASFAKMVRNTLRAGESLERTKLAFEGFVEPDVVTSIARRLDAEMMLLEGKPAPAVKEALGLTRFQIEMVSRIIDVRGAALLGHDAEYLMKKFNVVAAVANLQIDLCEKDLEDAWARLEAGADARELANRILVTPDAAGTFLKEIQIRDALLGGAVEADLFRSNPEMPKQRIKDLSAEVAALREEGPLSGMTAQQIAQEWRVSTASAQTLMA